MEYYRPYWLLFLLGLSLAVNYVVDDLLTRNNLRRSRSIKIDGLDTSNLTLVFLRRQIGIVQQDVVFLFPVAIRVNIGYGKLDAGQNEIWEKEWIR
ncbi:hypothetical protein ACFQ5D_02465 [Paenibacillus farraposensis]|uniref:Uncharacterized protein n=1 Tax=Paenibacillus farraposensis TaxID=2807095 RepID=A0ABW4DAZ9_9BACL|nr:hypothetical protein [Paenibacillus farraposensis]MCC3381763.1 hypothetical protein [Paenibacillus farraposensis]